MPVISLAMVWLTNQNHASCIEECVERCMEKEGGWM